MWKNQQPDGSVLYTVIAGLGNPGPGWVQEESELCCEHAAALAGFVGGCGDFTLSTGQVVRLTGNGFVHVGSGSVTVEDLVISPAVTAPTPQGGDFEDNTSTTGASIRFFGMNEGPEACRDACHQDSNCVAFTYVKKGAYESNPDNAVCYLKSSVGDRVASTCCISGVNGAGGSSGGGEKRVNTDPGKPEPGGQPTQPSGCTLAGAWAQESQGVGSSMWNLTDAGQASESGLGNSRGTATLTGTRLRIDWTNPNDG
jgi:hypothetical protein